MSDSALGSLVAASCVVGLALGSLSIFVPGDAAPLLILLGALALATAAGAALKLRSRLTEFE